MTFVLPSIGSGIIASPTSAPAAFNTYSVDFDGTDDKMQAGDSSTIASASVFTISAWARFHGTGQIFLASGTTNQDRIYMELNNTEVGVVVKNGAGGAARWTTSLSANTWYHIACTVDSGTSKLFVNGVYRATNTSIATLSATAGDDLSIGTDNGNGMTSWAFDGDVDEVAIFNTALSDGGGLSIGDTAGGDIATLYNSGTPGDLSSFNPTSWWRMGDNDGGTGTTITDQGSEGNDGTLVNGPTFSTNVPTFNTYSVDFDGTDDYVNIGSSGDVGTISIWFKPTTTTTSATSGRTLIGLTGISPYAGYGTIDIGKSWPNYVYGYFDGDWSYYHSSSSTSLSNTAWHHLVVHWSGTDYELYLNGGSNSKNAEQNYSGATKAKRPYSNLKIAKVNAGSQAGHDGLIDEVAIWHNPLSSAELAGLYNGGVPTDLAAIGNSGAGPNGWWRMGDNDGGTGTTITDQGSGGNDGTLTNGPTFSTDIPS